MEKLKQLLFILPESIRDKYLEYKYNKQLYEWNKRNCPVPPPHIVKQKAIKCYQEKHDINILVETGTYLGDMVYAQRKRFEQIYTIELSEELYNFSKKRLKKYDNIRIIHGDSGVALSTLMRSINKKTLFWLDGHYSGGNTAQGSKESPIESELKSILKSDIEHVILIDDARAFNGTKGYPTLVELDSILKKSKFPNSAVKNKDDIIRIELKK